MVAVEDLMDAYICRIHYALNNNHKFPGRIVVKFLGNDVCIPARLAGNILYISLSKDFNEEECCEESLIFAGMLTYGAFIENNDVKKIVYRKSGIEFYPNYRAIEVFMNVAMKVANMELLKSTRKISTCRACIHRNICLDMEVRDINSAYIQKSLHDLPKRVIMSFSQVMDKKEVFHTVIRIFSRGVYASPECVYMSVVEEAISLGYISDWNLCVYGTYICGKCGNKFNRKKDVENHRKAKYALISKSYDCISSLLKMYATYAVDRDDIREFWRITDGLTDEKVDDDIDSEIISRMLDIKDEYNLTNFEILIIITILGYILQGNVPYVSSVVYTLLGRRTPVHNLDRILYMKRLRRLRVFSQKLLEIKNDVIFPTERLVSRIFEDETEMFMKYLRRWLC